MKKDKFDSFWNEWVSTWYKDTIVDERGELVAISSLCSIREGAVDDVYEMYLRIKKTTKEIYFIDPKDKRLNRYKRAAVIAYAALWKKPLIIYSEAQGGVDRYFLKQRLAFMLALGSIIQDYNKEEVTKLKKPVFHFERLGNSSKDVDDFLMIVYKDMLFAEAYQNYNISTWAIVFCLLTEKASELSTLTPLS